MAKMTVCPSCQSPAVQHAKPHCPSGKCEWFVCHRTKPNNNICFTTYNRSDTTKFFTKPKG